MDKKTLGILVDYAHKSGASDIHITSDLRPHIRVDGELTEVSEMPVMTKTGCAEIASVLACDKFAESEATGEGDFAAVLAGVRCRINIFRQQGAWSSAIRLLNDTIPRIEDLDLPSSVNKIPRYNGGLVLITGETGSGKSTTLAAIIGEINRTYYKHVLTLEDPIEYLHTPDKCVISQREIGRDTMSFAAGLRSALREDPDIILVGEMRDLDTIETALTAAETGHLVFGTVHTNSAAESIDRLVDVFPEIRQRQIRMQLSLSLMHVMSQQLLLRACGKGRIACCEVMQVDPAIRTMIREGKTHLINGAIENSGGKGNVLMPRALKNLLMAGAISKSTYEYASQAGL